MATSKFSKNVTLRDMHSLITCRICGGYFVDATTITECLHTFCRSCIVKHFKKSLFCPECDVQVERGCPLNKLRPDPRKQLLAYKMVPHLHENEVARQWNFLKKHKPLSSSDQPVIGQRPLLPGDLPEETIRDRIVDKIHLYSPEDKISLSVEYDSGVDSGGCPSDKQLNSHKRYLQCPAALTVYHLKKFIRLKYDIGTRFKVTIFYEGEPLPDSSSLMDVAYQFFYEAKCPMRFTYRVSLCDILKAMGNVSSRSSAVPAKSPPTVSVKPSTPSNQTTTTLTARPTVRHQGSMSSAASSSDESTASNRRQQRQRSAKTAAYTAIEAMESDHDEAKNPPKRRRLAAKSPRWESDRDSPEPFPARVYITRRTPKTSLEDFEARYNTRPAVKRVYATNSDDDMSDPETKRNTLANKGVSKYGNFLNSLKAESEGIGRPKSVSNGRKPRSKRADEDVYEFNVNEDNEDSNTTQEYDFVYDNSDHETSELEKRREMNGSDRADRMERANVHENGSAAIDDDLNDVDADEHELEQQIEMEVITDTDDIERHIEDSIEEVEVDADDDNQDNEESQSALDDQLEAETTSSTCLVIAEDDEDDGVVEEVIAAEENGHELVVVEDPEENEISYPTESEKLSEDASRSPVTSTCSKSPTVEEDEPEIVHEKVFRKKSKKSKHHHHHHHHHHHKRKRHHSPVMLISSPEEAPMKLTLKLRPTPSISPGGSSSKTSNRSPMPESPTKENRVTIAMSPKRDANGRESPSQKIYTVKITAPKLSPPAEISEKAKSAKCLGSETKSGHLLVKPKTSEQKARDVLPTKCTEPRGTVPKSYSEPAPAGKVAGDNSRSNDSVEKTAVPDDVKERLTQMRQVRIKNTTITATNTPVSPPPSPAPSVTKTLSSVPDLKSVKTPSSLVISKVEAGETPIRVEELSKKPALEILVLPPSPPPSDRQSDDSEEFSTLHSEVPEKRKCSVSVTSLVSKPTVKDGRAAPGSRGNSSEQPCVLDLSDPTRRDAVPGAVPLSPALSLPPKFKAQQRPMPMQFFCSGQNDVGMCYSPHVNVEDLMSQATIATMNRMLASQSALSKMRLPLPQTLTGGASQQRRLVPALHDILRPVGGFAMPAASTRPGPNQSVRHIPNPSALLHRQSSLHHSQDKESKHQGQLTEQQLKERYHQFQQNRAAKAAFTYSRVNTGAAGLPAARDGPSAPPTAHGALPVASKPSAPNNNNHHHLPVKAAAIRPRSIEKVAGLLSVRAGAYAVEAQAGL